MSQAPDEPDAELRTLVSRFLERTITSEESRRLDRRLNEDPSAMDYCAEMLRFDTSMREALGPTPMEMEEVRSVTFDPRSGDPQVTLSRRIRLGSSARRSLRPWVIGFLTALPLALGAAWLLFVKTNSVFVVRNGDFEGMDLSQSPSPLSNSILFWQESFSTTGASLCDFNRHTDGRHYARSGRNVVLLRPQAFLNQLLLNGAGKELKAAPGLKVKVKGWYLSEGAETRSLRCSLRFVASGYPQMVQYEAAEDLVPLEDGGWHYFERQLTLSADLWRESTIKTATERNPPKVDLTGKPLTLSIDNYSDDGTLALDDLSIEVVKD